MKKDRVDPARLGTGYLLLDLGALTGASGEDALEVTRVEVERKSPRVRDGSLVIDQPVTITESEDRRGNLTVVKGGELRIVAPRFILRGNLVLDGGVLDVEDGALIIPQRYNHERSIMVGKDSRLTLHRAVLDSGVPLGVGLQEGAVFEVDETEFVGGITCDVRATSRANLRKALTVGELVVVPGAQVSIEESQGVLVWLTLGADAQGTLTLPLGQQIDEWHASHGLEITIKNSTDILWGVISSSGSNCTIENSELFAAGLYFKEGSMTLSDMHNHSGKDFALETSDRKLRFVNSMVHAWNFYADGTARVRVERSTYGESLAVGGGKMEIVDSTCDGSTGYVGADGTSELHLSRCTIASPVIAKHHSTITLESCSVDGDLFVADQASVVLIRSSVSGKIHRDPDALLSEKDDLGQ